jgi:hypothetical protein
MSSEHSIRAQEYFPGKTSDTFAMSPANYNVKWLSRAQLPLSACNRGLMKTTVKGIGITYTIILGLAKQVIGNGVILRALAVEASSDSNQFQKNGFILEGSPLPGGWGTGPGRITSIAEYPGGLPEHMDTCLRIVAGLHNAFHQLGILDNKSLNINTDKLCAFVKMDKFHLVLRILQGNPRTGLQDLVDTLPIGEERHVPAPRGVIQMALYGAISHEVMHDFMNYIRKHPGMDHGTINLYRHSPEFIKTAAITAKYSLTKVIGGFSFEIGQTEIDYAKNINCGVLIQKLIDSDDPDVLFEYVLTRILNANLNSDIVSIPIGNAGWRYYVNMHHEHVNGVPVSNRYEALLDDLHQKDNYPFPEWVDAGH